MKKLLLLVIFWQLSAFSAEVLPGEPGGTTAAAEAARKLADVQKKQQEAQDTLKKEQDQEMAAQVRLQQAQEAAKAHPTDTTIQAELLGDRNDLTTVENQVTLQEKLVTTVTEELSEAQAAAIQATKGTQTLPGNLPTGSMLDQIATVKGIESELAANRNLQEKIKKQLTGLKDIFSEQAADEELHLKANLESAQQLAAGLTNVRDFLQSASENSPTIQFTNREIDTMFLSGIFLPLAILSPDATTLEALSQKSLATQFYAIEDGLDALTSMTNNGTVVVRNEPVRLFVGDDAAAKGDLLEKFLVDCQKKLIDPLLEKTTTLSGLIGLMSDFPAESKPKVAERAQAVVADIVTRLTNLTDTLNTLLATPGYDKKNAIALASQIADFPEQFPQIILDQANKAFPELKDQLDMVSDAFTTILWDYSSFFGFVRMQILTLDGLSTIITKGLFCKFLLKDHPSELLKGLSIGAESVTRVAAFDALTRADTKNLTSDQRNFVSAVSKQYKTFLDVQAQAQSALEAKDFIAMEKAQDRFRSLYEDAYRISIRAASKDPISGMAKDFASVMLSSINAILEKYPDAVDSLFGRVIQGKKEALDSALYSFKEFFETSMYLSEKNPEDEGLKLYDFENAVINDYVNRAVMLLMHGYPESQQVIGAEMVALKAIAGCGGAILAKDAKKWLSPKAIPLTMDQLSEEDASDLAQSKGATNDQLGLFFTPETYQYVLDAYNTGKNVPVDSKGAQRILATVKDRIPTF